MSDIFEMLAAPFDPSEVDWRVGPTSKDKTRGQALCYVDARTVMDRLDTVCGPQGWQNRYVMEGTKTVCEIGIKCGEEWVWKADGAGDSDIEAEKGALSDAFKRAAVRWGIGRYLYNLKSPWVALRQIGEKTFVIADEAKAELEAILRRQMPAPPAKPEPRKEQPATNLVTMTVEQAENFANEFAGLVAEAKSNSDIDVIARKEKPRIEYLVNNYPALYESLQAIVKSTRSRFATKAAAE